LESFFLRFLTFPLSRRITSTVGLGPGAEHGQSPWGEGWWL